MVTDVEYYKKHPQCVSCGAYRVFTKTVKFRRNGREVPIPRLFALWSPRPFLPKLLVLAGALWLLGAYNGASWGVHASDKPTFIVLGLIALTLGLVWLINIIRLPVRYKFWCWCCGHNWRLDPGHPLPNINVRPDVIAACQIRWDQQQFMEWFANRVMRLRGWGYRY